MVIALYGVIECIHAEVQHAIVRVGILMDDLIYRTWLIMCREIFRSDEMFLVEVSLAHRNEVKEHQKHNSCSRYGHPSLKNERAFLAHSINLRSLVDPHQQQEYACYQQQRPERIPYQEGCPVGCKRFNDHLIHPCVGCTDKRPGNSRSEGAQCAESRCHSK